MEYGTRFRTIKPELRLNYQGIIGILNAAFSEFNLQSDEISTPVGGTVLFGSMYR